MWRGVLRRLGAGIKGKEVGKDRHGNVYYEQEIEKGNTKRFVEYVDDPPDPRSVPTEWHSWLQHTRAGAPTPEESARILAQQAALAEKVRELEATDAKLRLQEISEREGGMNDESADNARVERMIAQMRTDTAAGTAPSAPSAKEGPVPSAFDTSRAMGRDYKKSSSDISQKVGQWAPEADLEKDAKQKVDEWQP